MVPLRSIPTILLFVLKMQVGKFKKYLCKSYLALLLAVLATVPMVAGAETRPVDPEHIARHYGIGGTSSGPLTGDLDADTNDLVDVGDVDAATGTIDVLDGTTATFTEFITTGGVDEDYGVQIDQTTGTPTACPSNFVCLRNDDTAFKVQFGSSLPFIVDASGNVTGTSFTTSGGNLVITPSATGSKPALKVWETGASPGNAVLLNAGATDLSADVTKILLRILTTSTAAGSRGPVAGFISNGGTQSTCEEACDVLYSASSGVNSACVAGSCKEWTEVGAVDTANLVTCATEITNTAYAEMLCSVE